MRKEEFTLAARERQWPLIRQIAFELNDPRFAALARRTQFKAEEGTDITLYLGETDILHGTVNFPAFSREMHMDALQILLMYVQTQKLSTQWDTAAFSTCGERIRRDELLPMKKNFWTVSHYADVGLKNSLIEISDTPAHIKYDELFKAILGNSAIVEITDSPSPDIAEEFLKLVEDALKNLPALPEPTYQVKKPASRAEFEQMLKDAVGEAIKPEDPAL